MDGLENGNTGRAFEGVSGWGKGWGGVGLSALYIRVLDVEIMYT